MYILPVLSLFLSSVVNAFTARLIGHRGSACLTVGLLLVTFVSCLLCYIEVCWFGCPASIDLFGVWFSVGTMDVRWTLNIDLLAAQMLLTVTGVSFAVHIYAIVYMRADPSFNLFLSYLSLFTGFMLVLVSADNLMLMLIGWEGIGVCSYLLISYYSHRLAAAKSATKAILVNRISDGVLLFGILAIWWNFGSFEYDLLGSIWPSGPRGASGGEAATPLFERADNHFWLIGLALLVGAMGKSAQILFHVWLADAMDLPPSLPSFATLVTAST